MQFNLLFMRELVKFSCPPFLSFCLVVLDLFILVFFFLLCLIFFAVMLSFLFTVMLLLLSLLLLTFILQVIGNGNRSPVLSQKFWHNASSSPFPIDSGKRAASFLSWLHTQDQYLEDGVDLITDIQCGETFHLFALVSSGEFSISPILPTEGIGEASDSNGLQSVVVMDDGMKYLKRTNDEAGLPYSVEKDKKQKTVGRVDSDFCARREKGFPGINICIHRAIIPQCFALQCLVDGENHTLRTYNEMNNINTDMGTTSFAPSLSCLRSSDNSCSIIQFEETLGEPLFDQMTKYAEQLASAFSDRTETFTFCPELFKSISSVIDQAGEQGLNIDEISGAMGIQGTICYVIQ